jgi:cysteine-rich repeat protein
MPMRVCDAFTGSSSSFRGTREVYASAEAYDHAMRRRLVLQWCSLAALALSACEGGSSGDPLALCGNGDVELDEDCDDGNMIGGDGCSTSCTFEECGDAVVDAAAGEECDDGNVLAGDGCSPSCVFERCGNGITDLNEACDDGNEVAGDGCSATCHSDETCGNGIVDSAAGEECDDAKMTVQGCMDCRIIP